MTVFIRFQVLLLSALSAHALAGGLLIQAPNFLWQSLGIGAALFSLRSLKLEGPTLALLILFIQSTSHFLLGGGSLSERVKNDFGSPSFWISLLPGDFIF
jgi:hypothetical protein